MTFEKFQALNARRELEAQKYEKCRSWGIAQWTLALAGEVGELANFVKKIERGDYSDKDPYVRKQIAKELADIITYADLIYTKLEMQTEVELMDKFEEINQRIGWKP